MNRLVSLLKTRIHVSKFILFILFLLLSSSCVTHKKTNDLNPKKTENSIISCNYFGGKTSFKKENYLMPKYDINLVINKILKKSEVERVNFNIESSSTKNAEAFIYQGKRYILYSPDFLSLVNSDTNNKWSIVSILAHEIGHHIYGHLKNNNNRYQHELEADYFSGVILQKIGAKLEDSIVTQKKLGKIYPTKFYPDKNARIKSITNGWTSSCYRNSCNDKVYKNFDSIFIGSSKKIIFRRKTPKGTTKVIKKNKAKSKILYSSIKMARPNDIIRPYISTKIYQVSYELKKNDYFSNFENFNKFSKNVKNSFEKIALMKKNGISRYNGYFSLYRSNIDKLSNVSKNSYIIISPVRNKNEAENIVVKLNSIVEKNILKHPPKISTIFKTYQEKQTWIKLK